jgi:hypothetical protein
MILFLVSSDSFFSNTKDLMKKIYLLITVLTGLAFGCTGQTTYKDVAPIFYSRCTSCHHEKQHAPSMMNYSETFAQAGSIRTDLNSGKMPPWPPDTTYHRYLNERLITPVEKAAILSWLSGGALKGDTTLAPPAPFYSGLAKLNGTPDLILKIPTFTSNATTSADAYNCFSLPTGLSVDRVIQAYEIIPGNASIVHHVIANIDTTGTVTSNLTGGCFTEPGQFSIGGWVPGAVPTVFPGKAPLKAGIRLKAGSNMILQIHYPIGTAGEKDSTQIRIYFYPLGTTGIRPMFVSTPLQNWNLVLPAGMVTPFTAKYPSSGGVPAALSLFSTSPHSHKVCTSIQVCAYGPLADTLPLIRTPKWNFDWQGAYIFPKLVKIPKGYTLYSKHMYDNTTNNVNNPNSPPKLVIAGTSTTNEMLFDSFAWMIYQAGDDTINIGKIITSDPLVTDAGSIPWVQALHSYVFPNPFDESATLILTDREKVAEAEFWLYDMFGREVRHEQLHNPSADGFVIHKDNLPAGVYFYTLKSGNSFGSGKLVVTTK